MPDRVITALHNALRGYPVLLIVIVACVISVTLNPVKLGALIWMTARSFGLAYAGYWADRWLFPNDQPEELDGIERGAAWKRQAWIVSAFVISGIML